MMYEALLFDMNALGDIPDKDFTSRAPLAGSGQGEEGDRGGAWRREPATSREAETRSLLLSNFWVLSPMSPTLTSSRVWTVALTPWKVPETAGELKQQRWGLNGFIRTNSRGRPGVLPFQTRSLQPRPAGSDSPCA